MGHALLCCTGIAAHRIIPASVFCSYAAVTQNTLCAVPCLYATSTLIKCGSIDNSQEQSQQFLKNLAVRPFMTIMEMCRASRAGARQTRWLAS